jgi:hypothetical protein
LGLSSVLLGSVALAPTFTNAACDEYTTPAATATAVTLSKSVVEYGSRQSAFVRVDSAAGTPDGNVSIVLEGIESWTRTLDSGAATVRLPRMKMPAQSTYTVSAAYAGNCSFDSSASSTGANTTKFMTVEKARTTTSGTTTDVRQGKQTVSFFVRSRTGVYPTGDVSIRVLKNGKVVRQARVTLAKGAGEHTFTGMEKFRGNNVVVKFLGSRNFKVSSLSFGG